MSFEGGKYKELINEAFIEPIRTVTVIDDEYPTLLSLINSMDSLENSVNIERLKKIIQMCHGEFNWSVDVSDANWGADIPRYINHSDLIILDYHLDGNDAADAGEKARAIIKHLGNNNHYNLIVVHTKGYADDIERVFFEILKDLIVIGNDNPNIPNNDQIRVIDDSIDDCDDESITRWIDYNIPLKDVFQFLCSVNSGLGSELNPLRGFMNDIILVAKRIKCNPKHLLGWRFHSILIDNQVKFSNESDVCFKWHWGSDVNYICTGKTFISVVRKGNDEPQEEIVNSLKKSLFQYNATPMQLLMVKMRHTLDEMGFELASKIIANKHAQAGWLHELLKNSNDDFAHDKAIDLHWEQLATASKRELRLFSKKITDAVNEFGAGDNLNILERFFSYGNIRDELNLILAHMNAYSCSLPVSGNHLVTGTVLKIDDDLWLCVSPACDLVPGQKGKQWSERIGDDYMVFKAIRFIKVNTTKANEKSNFNEYIYIYDGDDNPEAYHIGDGSPRWDTFYAKNQGVFGQQNNISILCARKNSDSGMQSLTMKELNAKAVAELRYEYALNFLHKFGVSQTRVGLDFYNSRLFE